MYYVLLPKASQRQMVLRELNRHQVNAVFHYVPLHSSPAGQRYSRTHGDLPVTNSTAARLIRLPLWVGLSEAQQEEVVRILEKAIRKSSH